MKPARGRRAGARAHRPRGGRGGDRPGGRRQRPRRAPLHALGLDAEQALVAQRGDARDAARAGPARGPLGRRRPRRPARGGLGGARRRVLAPRRPGSCVHWIDPDRDVAQLVDLQQRFGLEAGRTEDGRVATDAVVIVASGDKHWFLTHDDLFEPSDDVHVKPREERALTQAIRSVLGADEGEALLHRGPRRALARRAEGRARLAGGRPRPPREGQLRARERRHDRARRARALRGLRGRRPRRSAPASLERRGESPPELAPAGRRAPRCDRPLRRRRRAAARAPTGLDEVLAPFGIALDDDVVHEADPTVAIPDTHGEGFFVAAEPHPVTASLVAGGGDAHPPRVATFFARSLRHVSPAGAASASDLLVTTGEAFAKTSLAGAAAWTGAPPRDPGDRGGPFVVAMAAERLPVGAGAPHGPRVVVVGSRFALAEDNWRQPRALHGAAFFVDSALSWLAARPALVDVPDRPTVAVAMRLSEEGRAEVRRYVLFLMPLAALLLAIAVWAWRRSSENTPYVPAARPADGKEPLA